MVLTAMSSKFYLSYTLRNKVGRSTMIQLKRTGELGVAADWNWNQE